MRIYTTIGKADTKYHKYHTHLGSGLSDVHGNAFTHLEKIKFSIQEEIKLAKIGFRLKISSSTKCD